jgi:glycolate oxidase FAD binding subunit
MQTAASVSSRAMRGITLYEPSEMVMGALAGTPLTQVEQALAERGQMLAFEPVDLGPVTGAEACSPPTSPAHAAWRSGRRAIISWGCGA